MRKRLTPLEALNLLERSDVQNPGRKLQDLSVGRITSIPLPDGSDLWLHAPGVFLHGTEG